VLCGTVDQSKFRDKTAAACKNATVGNTCPWLKDDVVEPNANEGLPKTASLTGEAPLAGAEGATNVSAQPENPSLKFATSFEAWRNDTKAFHLKYVGLVAPLITDPSLLKKDKSEEMLRNTMKEFNLQVGVLSSVKNVPAEFQKTFALHQKYAAAVQKEIQARTAQVNAGTLKTIEIKDEENISKLWQQATESFAVASAPLRPNGKSVAEKR